MQPSAIRENRLFRDYEAMPSTITPFDTNRPQIYIKLLLLNPSQGTRHNFNAILDTGAPHSEFADIFLSQAGFIQKTNDDIEIKPGLQTQKYAKIILPNIQMCGQHIENFEVMVSRNFESQLII